MFTKRFWLETFERAIKTAAQTVVAFVVAGQVADAFDVDWQSALGVALLGAVLSVLTSLGSEPFGPTDGPGLV